MMEAMDLFECSVQIGSGRSTDDVHNITRRKGWGLE
jgi:hypothetical protein